MFRVFQYLFIVYVINRVSYFTHEIVKPLIFYDFKHHYFEITTSNINHYSDIESIIVYLIPLNPYFIIGWFPIIILNVILAVLLYRMSIRDDSFILIKNCFSSILILYLIATISFAIMSGANNYNGDTFCDHCMLEIFLEGYAPYAPQLICGFIIGNVISLFAFLFIRLMLNKIGKRG